VFLYLPTPIALHEGDHLFVDAPARLFFRDQILIGTGRALLQRQGYAVGLTATPVEALEPPQRTRRSVAGVPPG
jgi:hypothetical protein